VTGPQSDMKYVLTVIRRPPGQVSVYSRTEHTFQSFATGVEAFFDYQADLWRSEAARPTAPVSYGEAVCSASLTRPDGTRYTIVLTPKGE
jgi:hypothetical protein